MAKKEDSSAVNPISGGGHSTPPTIKQPLNPQNGLLKPTNFVTFPISI